MKDNERRRAILRMTPAVLATQRVGIYKVVSTDVPSDAVIVSVRMSTAWSPKHATIEMMLEGPSLAAVPDGEAPPYLNGPVFEKVDTGSLDDCIRTITSHEPRAASPEAPERTPVVIDADEEFCSRMINSLSRRFNPCHGGIRGTTTFDTLCDATDAAFGCDCSPKARYGRNIEPYGDCVVARCISCNTYKLAYFPKPGEASESRITSHESRTTGDASTPEARMANRRDELLFHGDDKRT